MPLQATSGAASYDAFGGGVPVVPAYIEEVFSSYLWTGNDSSQTITNGIDLAGKGGLVWIKSRNQTYSHILSDTNRGTGKFLSSNTTDAQGTDAQDVTAFNTTGFTVGNNSRVNNSSFNYASWTFRKQPKFFDVVTYTGNGTDRTIAHNLGSVPGCIIIKAYSGSGAESEGWRVYHRSQGATKYAMLQSTNAFATASSVWNNTEPTSTNFTVGTDTGVNGTGLSHVAYVFAHDAGGFGLTGTDNVISCGSFDGTANTAVTLGYEPQWIMFKNTTSASNWQIVDNMRGMFVGFDDKQLMANLSNAESDNGLMSPTATGFIWNPSAAGNTYIYIAIRRGPMKVPTSGTSVFQPIVRTGTGANVTVTGAGFAPDLVATANRDGNGFGYYDKLRGALKALRPSQTSAEATYTTTLTGFTNTGYTAGSNSDGFGEINGNTDPFVNHMFARAPSFFDVVCYTGTGSARTITHNLAAVPELMIVKCRSTARAWPVYAAPLGNTEEPRLNESSASGSSTSWNSTTPTSSVFSVSNGSIVNASGDTYVAYLFATCAGVSKVGSYTGTATTLQVDCGFTGGARFVLIKRTDSTGDWYVWDSARGIVAGNDPYLLLNTTAAEVTSTDYVDTYSAGFEISSTAPAAINASGGTFVFLAIA